MRQYIPTLMEMYQDMVKKNETHWNIEEDLKKKSLQEKPWKAFYNTKKPYSDTMLHSIITIINKLNNR